MVVVPALLDKGAGAPINWASDWPRLPVVIGIFSAAPSAVHPERPVHGLDCLPIFEGGLIAVAAPHWSRRASPHSSWARPACSPSYGLASDYCLCSFPLMLIALVGSESRAFAWALIFAGLVLAFIRIIAPPRVLLRHGALLVGAAGSALLFLACPGAKLYPKAVRERRGLAPLQTASGLGDLLLGALVGVVFGVPWVASAVLPAKLL